MLALPPPCPQFSDCGNWRRCTEQRERPGGGKFKNRERSCAPGPGYEPDDGSGQDHTTVIQTKLSEKLKPLYSKSFLCI